MIHTVSACGNLNFSVNQILREINFGEFEWSKIAVLIISVALKFGFGDFLHFLLAQIL